SCFTSLAFVYVHTTVTSTLDFLNARKSPLGIPRSVMTFWREEGGAVLSFLEENGLLFQLPVSFLIEREGWANSPGYVDGEVNLGRLNPPRCSPPVHVHIFFSKVWAPQFTRTLVHGEAHRGKPLGLWRFRRNSHASIPSISKPKDAFP